MASTLEPRQVSASRAGRSLRALRLAMLEAIAARLAYYPAMTQAELAERLGITRPRLNRLLKKDLDLFGLDSLVRIALRAGLTVHLRVARPYRQR